MLMEISGEITPERMKEWSQSKKTKQKQKQTKKKTAVDVTGDRSKVRAVKSNIAYEPGIPGP